MIPGRSSRVADAFVVAAACALAGCSPESSPGPRSLVVAIANDPGHLNPAITTSGNVHPVADQIFNGLVGLDERLAPVPELAERWDVQDDGRTYRFHLRQGVRWHDGRPFTSGDVVFTFEQALLRFHSRTRAGLRPVLARIEAPDDRTVVFRLEAPYAPLLGRLDVVEAPIIPRHVYGAGDLLAHAANQRPVGTGPFRFVSYTRGSEIVLERNPSYFRAGLPAMPRVVFRLLPSGATATLALRRGEVDYLQAVPGPELAALRRLPDVTLVASTGGSGGSMCQEVLIPNLARPPLDRLAVRQAIYHALDRRFIVDRVYFGQGTPATGPISAALAWAYSPDVRTYAHDAGRARALLDGAGLRPSRGGVRARLRFTHAASFARLADTLRDQLRAVGLELALEPLDFNAAVDRVFVQKDFDLGIASYCNGSDPDIGVRRVYASDNIGPIPFSNGAAYRNPEVDRLFARAATTLDRRARVAAYARVQRLITEDLPYFWLVDSATMRAWRSDLTGFRPWTGAFLEAVRPAAE